MDLDTKIPDSWKKLRIRDVGEVVTGRTPSTKREDFYGGEYNLISPADLDNGKYVFTAHRRLSEKGFGECRALPKHTVLVGCIGNVGKLGIVGDERSATNQQINAVIPNQATDAHFLYYCLHANRTRFQQAADKTTLPILNKTNFENFEIAVPPLFEQLKIASVLGVVQQGMEQQARLLALTAELKKALVHQLFTGDLRGESLKQTDIGAVPESWSVVPLGDIMSEDPKNGLYKHSSAYGSGTSILRINDFSNDGDVVTAASNRVRTDTSDIRLYALRRDDIVTNRVNSLSHLGKTALIGELVEPMVFESNMMRFRVDERRALPRYILRLLNSPLCKKQIVGNAKRAVAQSSINQGNLKATFLPLPPIEVQHEIVDILETVVSKMSAHERMKESLAALLHHLLHQLMTAQIRVHNLDLMTNDGALGN
jgi:type I restriction enzyme S subunit